MGGVQPHFCPRKNVCFPIFSHGEKWGKKYMEREGNEYFSLSFHILFFPFFPMGKGGKTHIFPWQKWDWTPPPPLVEERLQKKKVYNYSKANWREFNFALRHINWDRLIGCLDPQSAWDCFQKILNNLCETHIPKRNVNNQFQLPWYDTECDKILREKEKWRKKDTESGSESDLDKFRQCRKNFKRIMNEKMRLNFEDSSDNSIISKKFWKHVKCKCKSTRIPETIKFGDQFRYKPLDQANLFNTYFFSQFSD